MPHSCAVIGCSNRSNRERDKQFFRVPCVITSQGKQTEELSRKRNARWLTNISRADLAAHNDWFRVCSDHFITGKPSRLYPEDSVDWAPTQNMGHTKLKEKTDAAVDRQNRKRQRALQRLNFEAAETLVALQTTCTTTSDIESKSNEQDLLDLETQVDVPFKRWMENIPEEKRKTEMSCQTDLTMEDLANLEITVERLQEDNIQRNSELYNLRERTLDSELTEEALKHNDEKVKFYTGLVNFCMLMAVFRHVSPYVTVSHRSAVNRLTEFLITLIRLRLNVPFQDLAYRFKISCATVSRIFEKWIEVMDLRLNHLILWPDREMLRKTMPMEFREKFGNKVSVILDCFEVFIERPSSLSARAMTWSNYKHHNTVKFLIGITPQGTISFISEAWGGRVSDKFLTEECGILCNLLPGDVVLADRGFTIEDSVGFYCAELNIPTFTKGKSQLLAMDVVKTRKIASVRIHVERVIGLVRRKFPILQGTLPVEFVTLRAGQEDTLLDKIARVCCSLTNLSKSVVPFD